jgi:cation transport regulator
MPYGSLNELPGSIKDNLPQHAQEIYLAAYNNALEQYKDPEKRKGNSSLEEVARKVAWAAVKKEYEKDALSGNWEKKL